jgi:putative transposase
LSRPRRGEAALHNPLAGIVTVTRLAAVAGAGKIGDMKSPPDPHYRHRFPAEIISHAVWLYDVFNLSLRDIELLLAERGIVVSYETVRRWCKKFGENFAGCLRRRRPRPGDKWHLDEVFIRIRGAQRYLWRAVDQDGIVLDILVQERRSAKAAKRFFKRLLKGLQYVPRVIVTDKLRSYGAAHSQLLPNVEHRQSRYLNNRAENSHRPTRRRERQMQRFKSSEQAQSFLFAHGFIHGHFHPRRHLMTATNYRAIRSEAFSVWKQETCAQCAG